jgi:hypothetical protein
MPAYLIIPDFTNFGFPVPYILASDGVFFFSFWQRPNLWLGKRILQEGNYDPCLPSVGAWLFYLPMREQKLYFLPNEYMRRFFK